MVLPSGHVQMGGSTIAREANKARGKRWIVTGQIGTNRDGSPAQVDKV